MATAAALLILAAANAAPTVAPECPAIEGQRLVYVDIFDGQPENQADLAPDATTTPSAGKTSNVWKLEAGADGLFVKCGYGTKLEGPYSRMETIRLPDTAKSCRADFTSAPGSNDLTLQKFSCR
ncbi:MAG TPA: STY0301 family protein [Stellaceae bacterium]|jgi:hypothetical protein|nr:STY0301 family protein [Stellaceae bacterium]